MYDVISTHKTEVGKVRQVNEDDLRDTKHLFAVADGMGGHQAGEVASSLALSVIEEHVEEYIGTVSPEKLVETAILSANEKVYQKSVSSAEYRNMGTTVTLLYREGDTAYVGHVGDSRAYLMRAGRLTRLTRDQSLVQTLVEEGQITAEEARHHPQRNIILEALGLEPKVKVVVEKEVVQPGDVFLLATDGLTAHLSDQEIEGVLSGRRDLDAAAQKLVDLAMADGGTDNITLVLVEFAPSSTVIADGARADVQPADDDGGKRRRREGRKVLTTALVVALVVVVLLAAGFAVGFYFYNHTFFVGGQGGRVVLYKGLPFWGLYTAWESTDIEIGLLPESWQRKVEQKLEPESLEDARGTIEILRREMEENSTVVPDVRSQGLDAATSSIEEAGLTVEVERVSFAGVGPDTVVGQEPAANERVSKGSVVHLEVSPPNPII